MFSDKLLSTLTPHIFQALLEDAAATRHLLILVRLIRARVSHFLLNCASSDHLVERVFELGAITLVDVSWVYRWLYLLICTSISDNCCRLDKRRHVHVLLHHFFALICLRLCLFQIGLQIFDTGLIFI